MRSKARGRVSGHRHGQEAFSGRRIGKDGRWVQRDMLIDRDHEPPFKWHRVIDEDTGVCLKDQAINLSTGDVVDLRVAPRPTWLPEVVTYEKGAGKTTHIVAPTGVVPRTAEMHLTAEQAAKLSADLLRD